MDPQRHLGVIKIYPTGQSFSLAEGLNSKRGLIVDNVAIAPAGTGGSVDVYASAPTDVVIDINGYYAPLSSVTLAQRSERALSPAADDDQGQAKAALAPEASLVAKPVSTGQKLCSAFAERNFRDTINVPPGATRAFCERFRILISASNIQLGCIFPNGSVIFGAVGGTPEPNCGW
jgi:hypothetical protein